jgi:hypothetical protein
MQRIALIGFAALLAVLLAPTALAGANAPTRPDDRPDRGQVFRADQSEESERFTPGVTDFPSRLGERGDSQSSATILVATDGGFDWGDAAIGAAGGVGLALLGAGLALATVRSRRPQLAV